jgi:hypothetical protein
MSDALEDKTSPCASMVENLCRALAVFRGRHDAHIATVMARRRGYEAATDAVVISFRAGPGGGEPPHEVQEAAHSGDLLFYRLAWKVGAKEICRAAG